MGTPANWMLPMFDLANASDRAFKMVSIMFCVSKRMNGIRVAVQKFRHPQWDI
jgi:hypothetical protein